MEEAIATAQGMQDLLGRMKAHVATFLSLDPTADGFDSALVEVLVELKGMYERTTGYAGDFASIVTTLKSFPLEPIEAPGPAPGSGRGAGGVPETSASSSSPSSSSSSSSSSSTAAAHPVGSDGSGGGDGAAAAAGARTFKHVLPGFRAMCTQLQRAWTAAVGSSGGGGGGGAGANGRVGFKAFVSNPVVESNLHAQAAAARAATRADPAAATDAGDAGAAAAVSAGAAAAAAAATAAAGSGAGTGGGDGVPERLSAGAGGITVEIVSAVDRAAAASAAAAAAASILHGVQFRFGTLFSVLVCFRGNNFFGGGGAASANGSGSSGAGGATSDSGGGPAAPRPAAVFPKVLSVSVGTAAEHRAAAESLGRVAAGGPRLLAVDSQYEVFQKISAAAEAALQRWTAELRGAGPGLASQAALQRLLLWLVNYHNIYSAPCRVCGRVMSVSPSSARSGNVLMPPTGRDFATGEAYHETCEASR